MKSVYQGLEEANDHLDDGRILEAAKRLRKVDDIVNAEGEGT